VPLLSPRRRRSRNRALTIAAWLALAGLLVLVVGTLPATAAQGETCLSRAGGEGSQGNRSDLGIFLLGQKSFGFRFDELLGAQTRSITVDAYPSTAAPRGAPRNVRAAIEEDVASAEGHNIGYAFTTAAEVVSVGGLTSKIRVCVGLDPKRVVDLQPGRYTGTVVLRAANYEDAAIPISATFRSPRSDGLKMAAGGVLLGLMVKMLTELGSSRRAPGRRAWDAVRDYVFQWSFPLAIILGVVTGWLGFVQMYEASETWGVGETDSITLFATCFGFQMGSIGGADMTKRLVG
jgi:hypothetical protein